MELLQQLKQPAREFTPIPFWFLNGDLQEEELERQLKDFASHGVYGVVLHPRMGLPRKIEYLEESYFYYISFIVKTAAELEMKVVRESVLYRKQRKVMRFWHRQKRGS